MYLRLIHCDGRSAVRAVLFLAAVLACLSGCSQPTPRGEPDEPHLQVRFHEDVLDHYLCYRLVEPPAFNKPNLALIDQFYIQPRVAMVTQPEYLCNPVSKEGSRVKHPNEHLLCYSLHQAPAQFHATIANQFRTVRVRTVFERLLCLPTGKSVTQSDPRESDKPRVVDHFKCYTAPSGAPYVDRRVRLDDQFGTFFRTVLAESWLCNPTEKVIDDRQYGPMLNNVAHLVCYPLAPEGPPRPQIVKAKIRNQFQQLALAVIKDPSVLCVPSNKSNAGPGP